MSNFNEGLLSAALSARRAANVIDPIEALKTARQRWERRLQGIETLRQPNQLTLLIFPRHSKGPRKRSEGRPADDPRKEHGRSGSALSFFPLCCEHAAGAATHRFSRRRRFRYLRTPHCQRKSIRQEHFHRRSC